MNPNDRYQICGNVSGLICTVPTRAEAFKVGTKHATSEDGEGFDIGAHDCPIEVFDCLARIGQPELWRYDDDSQTWRVIAIRKDEAHQ